MKQGLCGPCGTGPNLRNTAQSWTGTQPWVCRALPGVSLMRHRSVREIYLMWRWLLKRQVWSWGGDEGVFGKTMKWGSGFSPTSSECCRGVVSNPWQGKMREEAGKLILAEDSEVWNTVPHTGSLGLSEHQLMTEWCSMVIPGASGRMFNSNPDTAVLGYQSV